MENTDMNAFCGGGASEPLNSRGCKSQKICYNSDVYNHKYNGGFMKKFFAFTLAEVLITLGIIGVVAALTIPTLISNHQKKVYVTQLKKSVNSVSNGVRLILAEHNVDKLSDTDFLLHVSHQNHEAVVGSYITKYFNVVDSEYLYSQSRTYKLLSPSKTSYNYILNCYLMKLADGSEICLSGNGNQYLSAYIDINGFEKLPNTSGLDFFEVNFDDNGVVNAKETYNHRYQPVSYLQDRCYQNGQGDAPEYCFKLIMHDNWEITYY